MNNPRSTFTRTQRTFGFLTSFNANDHPQQQQQGEGPGTTDKDGLNSMPFLNNIHTIPLLSRTMGRNVSLSPIQRGDLDGFNAVPQMARLGSQQPMGSSHRTEAPYTSTPRSTRINSYEGDFLKMPKEVKEQDPCLCQSPSQQRFPLADRIETDSETEELSIRPPPTVSRMKSRLDLVLSKFKPEHRERLVATYHRASETAAVKGMLLVLQLLCHSTLGLTTRTVGLTENVGSVCLRLWNNKFRLRSTQRHLLWCMANARGPETLVFLTVALATPWLFCLSLLGFALSMVILLKKSVQELVFQIRLRMLL
ncbi:uncharacterized protein LOC117587106 [Drosophila guanche]|uniref:Uncharacterized protein n=1 Tax=Drosophila guanche TaxID=7266 RepID=A0A3B0KHP8_DROGU|nr:uncharacterized protein LOC117587106 [Drosophila guanche]SPP85266.1 Hypothetical predicted protein [Drosophila guanche]